MVRKLIMILLLHTLFFTISCSTQKEKTMEKAKQLSFKIDEKFIDNRKNGSFEIIAPLWWSVDIYDNEQKYEADLKQYSIEQRYVFEISWYIAEVNNGGHDQFYFNSTGIVAENAQP